MAGKQRENIFAVNKPKGPTSFTIVAEIRKLTGEQKVGHAGTLDPLASGVLVVGVGKEATKQLNGIVKKEKEYLADIKLGMFSATDDAEGVDHKNTKAQKHEITKRVSTRINRNVIPSDFCRRQNKSRERVTLAEIKNTIKKFVGCIDQVPPVYSAIKVGGERAYRAARSGEKIKLKSRPVEIKKIEILKYRYPDLKLRVVTGQGVYIRSLARDIGAVLGVGGYLADLQRTRVGDFTVADAVELKEIADYYQQGIIQIIKAGDIGILPTDTIYGLVGLALNQKTVERIYKVRKRNPDKPLIILIGSLADLKKFGVTPDAKTKKILKKYWPGKVSVVLPCDKKLAYLHRGTKTLAFRLPDKKDLIELLRQTGPLVAPSANPEGKNPALTIKQAKRYFSNQVDFYQNQGKQESEPSTLIRIERGEVTVLRSGAVKVP